MGCLEKTKQYYAEWLRVETTLLDKEGVFAVFNPSRDRQQIGYGQPFHLYALCTKKTTIISYGTTLEEQIGHVEAIFHRESDLESVKTAIQIHLGCNPGHAFKYYFESLPIEKRKVPIWSCSYRNYASQKLAESLGFLKLADVITITLPGEQIPG